MTGFNISRTRIIFFIFCMLSVTWKIRGRRRLPGLGSFGRRLVVLLGLLVVYSGSWWHCCSWWLAIAIREGKKRGGELKILDKEEKHWWRWCLACFFQVIFCWDKLWVRIGYYSGVHDWNVRWKGVFRAGATMFSFFLFLWLFSFLLMVSLFVFSFLCFMKITPFYRGWQRDMWFS